MDEQLVRWCNAPCGRWSWLDSTMEVLDEARPFYLMLTVVATVLLLTHREREARCRLIGDGLTALVAVILACLAARTLAALLPPQPRPIVALTGLHAPYGMDFTAWQRSFLSGRPYETMPSSHAVLGCGLGFCLVWLRPRLGLLVLILGLVLMVPPVLYFALHWPTDVIVSLALAGSIGAAVAQGRRLLSRPAVWLERLLYRGPLAFYGLFLAGATLVIWRGGPHSGLVKSLTGTLRHLLHSHT